MSFLYRPFPARDVPETVHSAVCGPRGPEARHPGGGWRRLPHVKASDLSPEDHLIWEQAAAGLTFLAVKYGQAITAEVEPWVGFLPSEELIGSSSTITFEERNKDEPRWVLNHHKKLYELEFEAEEDEQEGVTT